ncbi:MAG TPA: hypothetical protein VIX12_02760, partial [Candidatus Binataceae bacterium]
MSFPTGSIRAEDKLALILKQMRSVRWRLNSLALQRGIFLSLAILIAAGAIVYAGAFTTAPMMFLIICAVVAIAALAALFHSIRSAWRICASAEGAALIADERAELKGRLTTVVSVASNPIHGSLWAYLVEDTITRREEFVPERIERKRISRAIMPLIGSLALAAAAVPIARVRPAPKLS